MVFIKKLEFRGFKSFGNEKVTLNLEKGFTAVVGPNGSGKSNILDALCFVLGHLSSKTMRVEALTGLIYSGKNNEHTTNSTTVALHLDNSEQGIQVDAKNVVIIRSVDMEGKGIYQLNGQRVTRSQIIDILGLAGISPDGYNIVMQGQLAQMVSMSPLDRRELIERVAGIAAYDEKKEKAKMELEKADNNLSQINILLDEVKGAKEKLLKDKQDAEKWIQLSNEIEELEASIVLHEIRELKNKMEDAKKRLDEKNKQLEKLKTQEEEYYSVKELSQKRVNEIDEEIRDIQENRLDRIHQEITEYKSEHSRRGQELIYLEQGFTTAKKEYERISRELIDYEKLREEYEVKLAADKKTKKELDDEVHKLNEEIDHISNHITNIDVNFEDYTNRFKAIRSKLDVKENELKDLLIEKEKIEGEINSVKDKIYSFQEAIRERVEGPKNLREQKQVLDQETAKLKNRINMLTVEKAKIEDEINKLNDENRNLSSDLQFRKEMLIEIRTRVNALKETGLKGALRRRAVDALIELKNNKSISGVFGTIAELGTVSSEYVKALEVAAGGRLDYLIVKDDETAAKCIAFLKNNQLGRASFLPLNKIRSNLVKINEQNKEVIAALDLVKFDEQFRVAFEFVFGKSYIFNRLREAMTFEDDRIQKVTLDGDLIEPSGLMVGGYYQTPIKFTLEEEQKIPVLEKDITELNNRMSKLKSEREIRFSEIKKIDGEIRELEKDCNLMLGQTRSIDSRLKELDNSISDYQNRIREEEEALSEKEKLKLAYEDQINCLNMDISSLKSEYEEISLTLERSEVSKINKKLKTLDTDRNGKISLLREIDNQITKLETEIKAQINPRISELKQSISNLENTIPGLETSVNERKNLIAEIDVKLNSLYDERTAIDKELSSLQGERKELLVKLKTLEERLSDLDKERNSLNLGIARMTANQEAYNNQLNELQSKTKEYEIGKIKLSKEMDVEKVKIRISDLRKEKTFLEPINQKSIQEYEGVEKRFEELNSRRTKLIVERETIVKFMDELEGEKTKVFMNTYRAIDENFNKIFSRLSPDGEAHLDLEDKIHPFLGGVRIKAKPKGKEISYLESMSGGEKSITALALIFAIQQYQPAPFYILDEIDSNLDIANVVKVAELIKEFSKYSQFIVITQRDAMMARADVLFGVTMSNKLSRIVSVKLEEASKYAGQ